MKSLTQLSTEQLNEAVKNFGENTRQIRLAEFSNNSNLVLRLKMQRKDLEQQISYLKSTLK